MTLVTGTWTDVCATSALIPERGVAALVDGEQIAIFLVDDQVHAVGNIDPSTGAAVLSRGLVGSVGDRLTLASPLLKQRYDLRTGECLDDEALSVAVFPARLRDGRVEVSTL
jgi:nitrite reductase (NADH) small subunit